MKKRRVRQPGFMLLEVVIAVGLLVLGLAVIGAQIQQASERAQRTDGVARITFLAESKIAEIDTGLIEPEREIEDDFGRLFPSYAWRLTTEEAGIPNLFLLKLEILVDPARELEEEFDFDEGRVAQTYYLLRTPPRQLDLTADFGMEDEQADKLNENLAEIAGGLIDVRQFNPTIFRDLSMEEIVQLLPALMDAFGMQASQLATLLPVELRPQFEQIMEEMNPDNEDQEGDESGDTTGDQDGSGDQTGDETGDETGDGEQDGGSSAGGGDETGQQDSQSGTGERSRRPGARGGRRGGDQGGAGTGNPPGGRTGDQSGRRSGGSPSGRRGSQ